MVMMMMMMIQSIRRPTIRYKLNVTLISLFSVEQIRLVGSGQPHEGRLEVYYNGEWGTVCDDAFDDVDASVACFQLGLG